MTPPETSMIEVDSTAAEIIRRAEVRARALGETLGMYLKHTLPQENEEEKKMLSQAEAWNAFVTGMTALTVHLPEGYAPDFSREAIYDDRF